VDDFAVSEENTLPCQWMAAKKSTNYQESEMWNKVILGEEIYNIILWFLTYSMLGWIVESIYMSVCNRKITNRGFARGPFCPIYGVGALTVYFALRAYCDNKILLFICGSMFATLIEFVTAMIMQKIFGEIWWDYHNKPFNYKGILCLESSIAWGFYTIALFVFLQNFVVDLVKAVPVRIGRIGGSVLMIIFLVDFLSSLHKEKQEDINRMWNGWKERLTDRFL